MNLTSPAYGEYIRSRIKDNSTQNYTYYEPDFDIQMDGGTCHMSVQTSDGSAVAMTMTINLLLV
jgi:gamma-glutamyltranspeptidase/glutathione hydrolase/leukotriene-C4 hydrolase